LALCERSLAITRRASAKAYCPCTNETPCFDWFRRSFSGSHSKHTPAIPAMGSGKRPEGHTNVWLRSDLRAAPALSLAEIGLAHEVGAEELGGGVVQHDAPGL